MKKLGIHQKRLKEAKKLAHQIIKKKLGKYTEICEYCGKPVKGCLSESDSEGGSWVAELKKGKYVYYHLSCLKGNRKETS